MRSAIYKAFSYLGSFEAKALEKDSLDPRAQQMAKLSQIVRSNLWTAFGREHNFPRIRGYKDFKKWVPIRDYDGFAPYIEKMVGGQKNILSTEEPFMFAVTSGTTGKQKFIPITKDYIKEFRHASVASGFHMLRNYPGIANGVTLSVVSPAVDGKTAAGISYGAISGALLQQESFLLKKFIAPVPYEVYLIRDYETRYYTILRLALALPLTSIYTLNPSTIVVLLKRLDKYAESLLDDLAQGKISPPGEIPASVRTVIAPFLKADPKRAESLRALFRNNEFLPYKIWPTLQVVCCWTKAAAAFYLEDFKHYFGTVPICDISYGASEGRGTVSLSADKQILSLRSHFYEFIPEEEFGLGEQRVLLCDELESGKNYLILFTTSSGLYRYNLYDVVKVVGFHNKTPLLEFQYKYGNISSFSGEKITELQVVDAMRSCLKELTLRARYFTLLPEFKPEPHYHLLLEVESDPEGAKELPSLEQIADSFDRCLKKANIEYESKRDSKRLSPVITSFLPAGTYESLRKNQAGQGVPDAQIKLSHLNPKDETRDFLVAALNGPA